MDPTSPTTPSLPYPRSEGGAGGSPTDPPSASSTRPPSRAASEAASTGSAGKRRQTRFSFAWLMALLTPAMAAHAPEFEMEGVATVLG